MQSAVIANSSPPHPKKASTIRTIPRRLFPHDRSLLVVASLPDSSSSSSSSSSLLRSYSTPTSTPTPPPPPPTPPFPTASPRSVSGIHTSIPGPPRTQDALAWNADVWQSSLDYRRRIFCVRSLNMRSIRAIGFDLDYTLALYKVKEFEGLAFQLAVTNLVQKANYPPELLTKLEFDWRFMIRGLTIDKKRGNILKLDRHKYVKIAYHGINRPLTATERMVLYNEQRMARDAFEEPDYSQLDTLFSLSEAHLFALLVSERDCAIGEMSMDGGGGGGGGGGVGGGKENDFWRTKNYQTIYNDVRAAIDTCHRDGSLKRAVAANPSHFIHSDETIGPMLQLLRSSGRSLFLATNSLFDYTHVVMNYVLLNKIGDEKSFEWLDYFDVVLTGCGKPAFFTEKFTRPLFEVDLQSGFLMNTDNGSPMALIWEDKKGVSTSPPTTPPHPTHSTTPPKRARVFQGGLYTDLHRFLGNIESGSHVLYVGDHIYGDVLKSKKSLGWRTLLVVPELQGELEVTMQGRERMQLLKELRQEREALEDQMERLRYALSFKSVEDRELMDCLDILMTRRNEIRQRHRELLKDFHEQFHSIWGAIMKSGSQSSFFAHQLDRFSCLYTSHVNNLLYYSPEKSHRGKVDRMSHEDEMLPTMSYEKSEVGAVGAGGWGE